jgi:hypothetical protein
MIIDAIKATSNELHRVELAVRMVAGGRHPPRGTTGRVRHYISPKRGKIFGILGLICGGSIPAERTFRAGILIFDGNHGPIGQFPSYAGGA